MIEVNELNRKFVTEARKAGFTDDQIDFLSNWFAFASDVDDCMKY